MTNKLNLKKIIVFALLYSSWLAVHAQSTFNRQIDLEYPYHVLTSVLPTDSCYYATGVITDTTGQSQSIGNIFVKFDLEGNVLFYKKLASPHKYYETWLGDLIADSDGSLLAVGTSSDSTTHTLLVRYGTDGDTLSTTEIQNPLYPSEVIMYSAELVLDSAGVMYILGRVDSEELENPDDIYLYRLPPQGGPIEVFTYGEAGTDLPFSMVEGPDGGLIVGSCKTNNGDVWENFYSRTHVFGIDSTGEMEWEFITTPAGLYDTAKDMLLTSDGGIVVATGRGIEHPINSVSSQLRWNSFLFKLDANHKYKWGRELKGVRHSGSTGLLKVVEADDGSGYISMGNLIEDKTTGEPVYGSWVVKVSPQGDSLWARYYTFFDDVQASPRPKDLKNTPDGGYVIVGETWPQLPTGQAYRAWIMKVDGHGCLIPGCHEGDTVSTTTVLPTEPKIDIAVYPNPTSDFLNFQLRTAWAARPVTFRIIDSGGRVVKEIESTLQNETHIVPVHGWLNGVYFLQYLKDGNVFASEQFVVER